IDHEAMEPDLEALGVSEPRELAPGEEECLLDRVLCSLDVPENPVRDGVAAVTVQVDEIREGALVAVACPLDQPVSHDLPPAASALRALHRLEMVAGPERFKDLVTRGPSTSPHAASPKDSQPNHLPGAYRSLA